MSRVSVILVNFNGRNLLHGCLGGLEAQTRAPDEVILVDNGSTDGSIGFVERNYPWVRLIRAGRNLGFAEGNNLGIRASTSEIVILLNNDTLPAPGFVERIIAPLEKSPSLSAVAGVMLFSTDVETVATTGIEMYENGLALDRDVGRRWRDLPEWTEVFGPSAGAAAYRRSALDDVGMFPEPFFMYLEDADLAWRLRLRGHKTVSVRDAWVLHIYSASAEQGSPLKDYLLARNRAWTILRCWPGELWRAHWRAVLKYEIGAVLYGTASGRWSSVAGRLRGWTAYRRLRASRILVQRTVTSPPNELLYWICPAPSVRGLLALRRSIGRFVRASPGQVQDH